MHSEMSQWWTGRAVFDPYHSPHKVVLRGIVPNIMKLEKCLWGRWNIFHLESQDEDVFLSVYRHVTHVIPFR